MAGNETVFSPNTVDEQVHNRSEVLLEPATSDIGGIAIQAAESDTPLDIRFFMRRSADMLVELGLLGRATDRIGNDYFRGLREVEDPNSEDEGSLPRLLLRLAAGCVAFNPREDKVLPGKDETPEDKANKEDLIKNLEHMRNYAFNFFLDLKKENSIGETVEEVKLCFEGLRAREMVLFHHQEAFYEGIDAKNKIEQTEMRDFLSSSIDRARRVQAVSFQLDQKGLLSLTRK